ncbi:MAG: hypothetical protein QXW79_00910 [Thermoplasmata archaeon]
MESWIDKYKPKKLSEVIGNKEQIKKIEQFVKQYTHYTDPNKITRPNIIITGSNGIGKTLIIDLVLEENGFEKVTIDLSNISVSRKMKKKKKSDQDIIGTNKTIKAYYLSLHNSKKLFSNNYSLLQTYSNDELPKSFAKKIALVFDDVSNITNPKEKEVIKLFAKLNNKMKSFPIIIIAGHKHSKTINELKKIVSYVPKTRNEKKENIKIINEVFLKPPSYEEMERLINNICSRENISIVKRDSDEEDVYVELINHAQYDIRRLINILEELKMIYQDSEITLDKIQKYKETSKTKDLDPGIYNATSMLLDNYTNISNVLAIYGEERSTIPLMVHENYPLNIREQYPKISIRDQIDLIYIISKNISESDKIDGLIYSNQCWNLQPVHGFYSCVMPSYHINKLPNKLHKMVRYGYTQDYNKTSIKKINNKIIKNAQKNRYMKKVSIHDFLYMASILKTLFDRKEFEKIAVLMKPYNLKFKEIESIIKIDKIKKSKNLSLTGKQKYIINNMMEDDK